MIWIKAEIRIIRIVADKTKTVNDNNNDDHDKKYDNSDKFFFGFYILVFSEVYIS